MKKYCLLFVVGLFCLPNCGEKKKEIIIDDNPKTDLTLTCDTVCTPTQTIKKDNVIVL